MASKPEIIERLFAALAGGDSSDVRDLVHPAFEADWTRSIGPDADVFDLDRIEELQASLRDIWSEFRWEPAEFIEVDEDRVLVDNRFIGTGRGSGVEIRATGAQLWTFRGERPVKVEMFQSKEEALAELGLR